MAWIKRNLIFVVGSLIALLLMGGAGVYTFTRWRGNSQAGEELKAAYDELKRLNTQTPHPGDGKTVNNIELARQQQQALRRYLTNALGRLKPIPPVPSSAGGVELQWGASEGWTNLTRAEFGSALRLTVAQLQREATNQSVSLPGNYSFSFEAQRQRAFEIGNLGALAVQLGEVKAICDILNAAKVNALLSVRRERVSAEDNAGPLTDYLSVGSETNEMAVLTPYEVNFQSFGAELAAVVAGFANSPHGILVKSINVRPASAVPQFDTSTMTYAPSPAMPMYVQPQPALPPGVIPGRTMPAGEMSDRDAFRQRYGLGGGAGDQFRQRYGIGPGGGKDSIMSRYQQPAAPPPVAPVLAAPGATAPRGGLQPMLDEQQLDVTITLRIVKLLPAK